MSEYRDAAPDPSPPPLPADAAEETAPRAPTRRRRGSRQVIGPFTVRHLGILGFVLIVSTIVMYTASRPIGPMTSGPLTNTSGTFYRIGPETQGVDVGQRPPDFTGTDGTGQQIRLTDLDGRPLSLADLAGRPVWVNFWATWCPPCQKETPVLRDAFEANKAEGLVLVSIDVQEEPVVVRDYVERYGLGYTIGMDTTGAIFRTYRVFGLPTNYFIGRDGIIRDRVFGPLDSTTVEQMLGEILGP